MKDKINSRPNIAIILRNYQNTWHTLTANSAKETLWQLTAGNEFPRFSVFSAENNLLKLASTIQNNISKSGEPQKFDAILTVGSWASREVRKLMREKKLPIPQICAGVKDPTFIEADPYAKQIAGITGVNLGLNRQVEILQSLRPDVRKVSILQYMDSYNVSEQENDPISGDARSLRNLFEKQNIEAGIIGVRSTENLSSQIEQDTFFKKSDVICTTQDIADFSHTDELIEFCEYNDKTFYASEITSLNRGAALGFGAETQPHGWEAGKALFEVLYKGSQPEEIGFRELDLPGKLFVNNRTLGRQGMRFDQKTHLLIEGGFWQPGIFSSSQEQSL